MPFDMKIAYSDLKTKIENCIKGELSHRGLDPNTDISKLTSQSDLKKLSVERLQQLQFLKTVMEQTAQKKVTAVLLSSAYFVAGEIEDTYKIPMLHSPENSMLYSSLMTAIGGVKPSSQELHELYSSLKTFLHSKVYMVTKDKKTTTIPDSPFDLHGPIIGYIQKLISIVAGMDQLAAYAAYEAQKNKEKEAANEAAKKAAEGGFSWLSMFTGSGGAKVQKQAKLGSDGDESAAADAADINVSSKVADKKADAKANHKAGTKADSSAAAAPVPKAPKNACGMFGGPKKTIPAAASAATAAPKSA